MKYIVLVTAVLSLLCACEGPRREINRPVVETEPVTWLHTRDCPNWRDGEHASNYGNTTFPNFGCASAHNIGQVLENPDDYINGTGHGGTADAERAAAVFVPYREPPSDLSAGETSESSVGGSY
jgi:type IV pilus biogenesis protein CpaD/CtpE